MTSWHATSAADHPAPLTTFIPNLPPPPAKAVVPHVKPKVATKPKASKPKVAKPKVSKPKAKVSKPKAKQKKPKGS